MASGGSSLCVSARSSTDYSGELWLPDQLSPVRDLPSRNILRNSEEPQFPFEFPYVWNSSSESSFNSPVESFAGSNDTESEDGDDYIAGLAQRVAHSMLDDDDVTNEKHKLGIRSWTFEQKEMRTEDNGKASMAVSPQSTLPGLGSWPAFSWSSRYSASSEGSSRVSSQVSSPPSISPVVQDDSWDILHSAAGEVVRLEMLEEARGSTSCFPVRCGLQHPPTGPVPGSSQSVHAPWGQSYTSVTHGMHLPPSSQAKELQAKSSSFSTSLAPLSDKSVFVQAHNFQRSQTAKTNKEEDRRPLGCQHRAPKTGSTLNSARQVKPVLQQQSSADCRSGQKSGSGRRAHGVPDLPSSQWPSIQQAGGSGMRAVFLGSNGSGRESSGTGVFLPRRVYNGPESKKKPACSTVLLPTRIVQALNLNVEDVHSLSIGSGTLMRRSANNRKEASYVPSASTPTPASLPTVSFQTVAREVWTDCERRAIRPIYSPKHQVASEISLPTEWTY